MRFAVFGQFRTRYTYIGAQFAVLRQSIDVRSFCFCLMSSDAKSILGTILGKISLFWIYIINRRRTWYTYIYNIGPSLRSISSLYSAIQTTSYTVYIYRDFATFSQFAVFRYSNDVVPKIINTFVFIIFGRTRYKYIGALLRSILSLHSAVHGVHNYIIQELCCVQSVCRTPPFTLYIYNIGPSLCSISSLYSAIQTASYTVYV